MEFRSFSFKETNLRFRVEDPDALIKEVLHQRKLLEAYIQRYPRFLTALSPLPPLPDAPSLALDMHHASEVTGVGPMAAVAGTLAERAARAGRGIVENGGDIFILTQDTVVLGIYAGKNPLSGTLGFRIEADQTPIAVCSSSGRMGHSLSFGNADLVTVFSRSGALADAAATLGGNLVQGTQDIEPTLERLCALPDILGAFIVVNGKVGFLGEVPPLISIRDQAFHRKITRDFRSGVTLEDL